MKEQAAVLKEATLDLHENLSDAIEDVREYLGIEAVEEGLESMKRRTKFVRRILLKSFIGTWKDGGRAAGQSMPLLRCPHPAYILLPILHDTARQAPACSFMDATSRTSWCLPTRSVRTRRPTTRRSCLSCVIYSFIHCPGPAPNSTGAHHGVARRDARLGGGGRYVFHGPQNNKEGASWWFQVMCVCLFVCLGDSPPT